MGLLSITGDFSMFTVESSAAGLGAVASAAVRPGPTGDAWPPSAGTMTWPCRSAWGW